MANVKIRRKTGSSTYDVVYPAADWSNIDNKPSTFTPTSHTHGDISNGGAITSTVVTPASGDNIIVSDSSASDVLKRGITIGTSTSTFLRNDGTWATPAGVDNYVNITGDTMTGTLVTNGGINANNNDITNVNQLSFNDPGPNEGLVWNGGNAWKFYESPNDLSTNGAGNLQIVQNTTRRATFNTSGQLELPVANGTAPLVITSTTAVSNLNADLLDGMHAAAIMGYQSPSEFADGTLVRTSINASVSTGDSFTIEIEGKSYTTSAPPFKYIAQGYLYNGAIINYSGLDIGANLGTLKIFEDSGNLCFWWARVSYWNSFKVNVYRTTGVDSTPDNTVTAITNSTELTGTKKVTVSAYQVFSTYHLPLISEVSGLQTALDAKAPAASPTFTGNATFDTNTLFVDATNDRVGIGTTSPVSKLDVVDTFHITNSQNTQHGIMIENRATYYDSTGKAGIWSSSGAATGPFSGQGAHLVIEGRKNSDRDIYIKVGDTTAASHVFKASGNVGINTLTPSEKLEVNGVAKATSFTSTVALGTAPLTVTSSTKVNNLNADFLDGYDATSFMLASGMSSYAPLASPALTGTPTAPTATAGTNTTQIATTAFVSTAVANLINSAPGALDTLDELAAALGDDANFATTITNSIAGKVAKSGDTMTGDLTISSTYPRINLTDTNHNSDYSIINNDGSLGFWDNTNSAYRMHILSSGNVGIGRTDPQDLLNIHNSSANANIGFKITRGAQTHGLRLGVNDSHAFLWTSENQDLAFATNNLQRLTIASGGNIGIGTTSPSYSLHVAKASGDTYTAISSVGGATLLGTVSSGNTVLLNDTNDKPITIWTTTGGSFTEKMRVTGTGNVGIGTTSPSEKLEVNGVAKATSFTSTVATGTAPISVTSTTVATNLNADLLDGQHGSAYQLVSGMGSYALSNHTHGNISNGGGWQSSPATIANGDSLVITQSGLLRNTNLSFNTNTDAFLAQNGTWVKPIYTSYKSTQQTNDTTTAATYHSITLPHSGYYSITVYGMWSKTTTTNLVGNVISVITSDNTGTPKFDGAFEWQQTTTASAFTTENNSINIPTSGTSLGITTQTATQSRTETYWSMKGFLYTGTTNDKTLSFQFACSTAPGTGSVALEKIAIVATKVG